MGLLSKLFGKKKEENPFENEGIQYFVKMDEVVFGPFSLEEIRQYPLLDDTLVTTNTLNGEYHEAKYFECFDDIVQSSEPDFKIADDGTIIYLKQRNGIR